MGIPLDRFSTFILENARLEDAVDFLRKLGVEDNGIVVFEQLKIDDVRWIKQQAEVSREKRGFVIGDPTYEAQNAMLKLTEEPPESAYFVFYKVENLLETIYSRAQIIRVNRRPSLDEGFIKSVENKQWQQVMEFLFSLNEKTDILDLLRFLIHYYAMKGRAEKSLKLGDFYRRFKEFNLNDKLLLMGVFSIIEEQ